MERQVDAKLGWKHQGYLSIKYSKTGSDRKSKKVAILKVYSVFIAPACRRPIFRPSVRLSTFMSTFDIYVIVSILINYKIKQPSNLAWNISLTSWLCYIGVRFSICLSICPSVCQHLCRSSTFMSVSILINYKTKQPSNLAWNISLTSRLYDRCPLFHPSVCSPVCLSVC